jgi:glyoxylase-like metal-dependent hydrolase (beta-lactamase superfamily II)
MFAPTVFSRSPSADGIGAHIVHKQPSSEKEIDQARASLSACPVSAIRVETKASRHHRGLLAPSPEEQELAPKLALNPKFNGLDLPFPRPLLLQNSTLSSGVYFVGHHNERSFGAAPYLVHLGEQWILVDTPRYSTSAVKAVESLTGPDGPHYLLLTHVDDSADHGKWKEQYPKLRRILHAGDLGRYNWVGDLSLETVEILLQARSVDDPDSDPTAPLQFFQLNGTSVITSEDASSSAEQQVLIVHTPGHSPGSICLWIKPTPNGKTKATPGVLFTGDTYAYTTRNGGHMTGFPRYGNNLPQQARILSRLVEQLDFDVIAPGHGHVRDYTTTTTSNATYNNEHFMLLQGGDKDNENRKARQKEELQPALDELVGGRHARSGKWSLE